MALKILTNFACDHLERDGTDGIVTDISNVLDI